MKAILYSKDNCPYCVRAKSLLSSKGVDYEERNAVEYREALIAEVTAITGGAPRTVPQIFLEGKYIGGYDDLVKHYQQTA